MQSKIPLNKHSKHKSFLRFLSYGKAKAHTMQFNKIKIYCFGSRIEYLAKRKKTLHSPW